MNLTEAKAELEAAKAEGRDANLRYANLYGAKLYGANLHDVNLYGANLQGADLRYANLRYANLRSANLRGAYLYGVNLYGANLQGADLRDANLHCADLRVVDLYGTYLYGADLHGMTLVIAGHPSGAAELAATPNGWQLRHGCWGPDTVDSYRAMVEGDDWPESEGDEQDRRRPSLLAIADLCDAHAAMFPDLIDELAAKWGTTTSEPSKMVDMKEVWA